MTATFSATVMVHSCVGVGLTAGHFVPRLRGNDKELRNSGDKCVIPEIGFACNVGFVLRFCALERRTENVNHVILRIPFD
jgi:hypothetical protein